MSEAVDSPISVLKLLPDLLCKMEIVVPSSWSWRPRRCDVTSVLSQSCVASAAPSSYIRAAICFEGKPAFSRIGGDSEVRSSPPDHSHRASLILGPLQLRVSANPICTCTQCRSKPEAVYTRWKQTNKQSNTKKHAQVLKAMYGDWNWMWTTGMMLLRDTKVVG